MVGFNKAEKGILIREALSDEEGKNLNKAYLRINRQAKPFEISIKSKTWDALKHMGNYNVRKGVAERDFFVPGEFLEKILSSAPDGIIVSDDMQRRFDRVQKFNSSIIVGTVSEKGHGFADDVPGSIKGNFILLAKFEDFTSPVVIGVLGA